MKLTMLGRHSTPHTQWAPRCAARAALESQMAAKIRGISNAHRKESSSTSCIIPSYRYTPHASIFLRHDTYFFTCSDKNSNKLRHVLRYVLRHVLRLRSSVQHVLDMNLPYILLPRWSHESYSSSIVHVLYLNVTSCEYSQY